MRLRTLVPKIDTLLLHQIRKGRFPLLTSHRVLTDPGPLIANLECRTRLTSDHDSNYFDLSGKRPADRHRLLDMIVRPLPLDEDRFRPHYIGTSEQLPVADTIVWDRSRDEWRGMPIAWIRRGSLRPRTNRGAGK